MSRLKQFWIDQQGRRFLWLPVLFASGIAIYFALPTEPDWRVMAAATIALGLFAAWPNRRYRLPYLVPAIVMAGLCWAAFYTSLQHPAMLKRELTPRPVSGTVEDIERVENGVRLTLANLTIRGLETAETPNRIRLSLRLKPQNTLALPHIGDEIALLAGLLPPMGAALPGGFDFARYFYFRDIGAVGYGLPPWKVTKPATTSGFGQWRIDLTDRIIATLGPRHGPIAAGLITGEDRAIQEGDFESLRAANLYHIIAISGGHMVVIAGVIFVSLRLLLLLVPFGLRPQAKSVAAAATLGMVTLYLFVTGLPISAVRAYVMIALVLIAVMLRRDANAMRSLMLAALIMLLVDPSDLLEPGFQLSFIATLAIVALAEGFWLAPLMHEASWFRHAGRAFITMILVSFVAEGAVSLLAVGMFNNFSPYGVLANALATPLVAFVVMPAVALFFVLLPLGLEHAALWLLDFGIQALMWIARTVSALPHAQIFIASPPGWGIGLAIAGLLVLCLIRQRIRWAGLLALAIGWASILTQQPPAVLVGANAKQIALATPQGYRLVRGRPDSLIPQLWANGLGSKTLPFLKPGSEAWRCDRFGCMATVQQQRFSFPQDAYALLEDCQRADYIIAPLRTRHCHAPMIGSYPLARFGVHAFWIEGDRIRHESSADWQGRRPWSALGAQ